MILNTEQIKSAADIVEVISDYVKLKQKGANHVGLCPFHNEKTPSFTVSPSKGMYKCFGCGKSGDAIEFLMEHEDISYPEAVKHLAERYNIPLESETKQEYKAPAKRLEKLKPETIRYFETRGISNNTLLRFGITESIEWMPGAEKDIPVICFNYIRNEELVNIKFRGKGKDFKMNSGSELIFYNLDAIKGEEAAVIVEGEIDCLSLHEAGIYNVISVPNGAAGGKSQLKYLDNCWKDLEHLQAVTLFTDKDGPGQQLAAELARRIGKDKCFTVTIPDDCKDANDILVKYGRDKLKEVVSQSRQWPLEGVLGMDDLFEQVQHYYEHGYPKGASAKIGAFDDLLTFAGSQITVVTGPPGSGKSEFIDNICVNLAKWHDWKFGVCSFENEPSFHVTKLMEKYTGLAFDFRKNPYQRMNRTQFEEAAYFVDQYFRFVNISNIDVTIDGILQKMRELVRRLGVKGILIDPWNYIEHKIPANYTETQYISEALTKIKEFSVKTDTHIFIVAHPKKLMKDQKTGKYPIATLYDIAGSAHFFNKTDNGISINRDFEQGIVDVYVQKVRHSWLGKCGFTSFTYDTFTRQYKSI